MSAFRSDSVNHEVYRRTSDPRPRESMHGRSTMLKDQAFHLQIAYFITLIPAQVAANAFEDGSIGFWSLKSEFGIAMLAPAR